MSTDVVDRNDSQGGVEDLDLARLLVALRRHPVALGLPVLAALLVAGFVATTGARYQVAAVVEIGLKKPGEPLEPAAQAAARLRSAFDVRSTRSETAARLIDVRVYDGADTRHLLFEASGDTPVVAASAASEAVRVYFDEQASQYERAVSALTAEYRATQLSIEQLEQRADDLRRLLENRTAGDLYLVTSARTELAELFRELPVLREKAIRAEYSLSEVRASPPRVVRFPVPESATKKPSLALALLVALFVGGLIGVFAALSRDFWIRKVQPLLSNEVADT